MFTDMVGYTALGQRNEALSLALVDEQKSLIRPILAKHGGREVKTIGDAFLVEFPSAVEAVRCAYEIQRAAREFSISLSPESRIHLRVGVHLGEVVESKGDISGDAVNVASRIEPLADDGGVCVTRPVYDQVRGKVSLELASIGTRTLKNVAEPLEVFKMAMPWEGFSGEGGALELNLKRIAVLPFVSLSPDPNDEYFADGLTEELITKVSFVKGLEVIARTSAMNYKKKEKNASVIGRELRVGTLLEGSVRKAGNRIRVTAQLINANNETHLWAESYDRNLDDIFEVQSSVAERVAEALRLKLVDASASQDEARVDPEAYTMFLRAMQLINTGTQDTMRTAKVLLEGAIAKDPRFARAHAMLSGVLSYMTSFSPDRPGTIAEAEAEARKALELAPLSADSHLALALVHSTLDRFDELDFELNEALRINPNLAFALDALGVNHLTFGRLDEAVAALQKAASLDPLSPWVAFDLGSSLRISGRVDQAMALFERMESIYPEVGNSHVGEGLCYIQKGDLEKARACFDRAAGVRKGPSMASMYQGLACGLGGSVAEAESFLASLEGAPESIRSLARMATRWGLGDAKGAMDELLLEAKAHSWYPYILSDPLFRGVLKEPRGQEFCRLVGLPPP